MDRISFGTHLRIQTTRAEDARMLSMLKLLRNAEALPHSGYRSLFEHLCGTWGILTNWGMPKVISRAGLFHSVYSTTIYPEQLYLLSARSRIRSVIGQQAEHLVYLFCNVDRIAIWERLQDATSLDPVTIKRLFSRSDRNWLTPASLRALMLIEMANISEQSCEATGGPSPWMARITAWARLLDFNVLGSEYKRIAQMSYQDDQNAIDCYHEALSASDGSKALSLAQRLNPWAGELYFFQALQFASVAKRAQSIRQAQHALSLWSRWGVCWDRRIPMHTWIHMAHAIIDCDSLVEEMPDAIALRTVLGMKNPSQFHI